MIWVYVAIAAAAILLSIWGVWREYRNTLAYSIEFDAEGDG